LPQKRKKQTAEEGQRKRLQKKQGELELLLRCPFTVRFWDVAVHHAILWLQYRS